MKLDRSFFQQPTLTVAKDLIGARLNFYNYSGIITETEAYIGKNDPACHASKGMTPRTKIMFGPPGFTYVYLIYGMYHCLNIVTESENFPAAVLIRGVICDHTGIHLNGPGKLCRAWKITKDHNAMDVCDLDHAYLSAGTMIQNVLVTQRIGIKVGLDLPWRFVMSDEDIQKYSLGKKLSPLIETTFLNQN